MSTPAPTQDKNQPFKLSLVKDAFTALRQVPGWMRRSHQIQQAVLVSQDFVGVNIATSEDPAVDDYVVDCLQDLGINQVRLAYSYCSQNSDGQRLLDRVLADGFEVLLDLLPSAEAAQRLGSDPSAQVRWRTFLIDTLDRYAHQLTVIEIGNTPNRSKWSGFDAQSYLETWRIAAEVASNYAVELAGPNVSDFEPLYNIAFLSEMQRIHSVPAIQTTNLFVERVIEPERFDHRVLGKPATFWLKLNLIKKARILKFISDQFGIGKTFSTYCCWTRKRLARWNQCPQIKHADYLFRYLVLAAASGALTRVYWGPLICQRDGLVHCGRTDYPVIDNVTFYQSVRGQVADFNKTTAYHAIKQFAAVFQGTQFQAGHTNHHGISFAIFTAANGDEIHTLWCSDRMACPLNKCYPQMAIDAASICDHLGQPLTNQQFQVNEHPLILHWPQGQGAHQPQARLLDQLVANATITHRQTESHQCVEVALDDWQGALWLPKVDSPKEHIEKLSPPGLLALEEKQLLRDKRNRLWNVQAYDDIRAYQTVKLNRAKGIKKFTYRFLPSKGQRHWDNATEMLRRGINTPQPLAFFERPRNSGIEENYYISEFIEDAFSCRNLFLAFSEGKADYQGISKETWLEFIGGFVARMHIHGVIHRDLSSGNLLMTVNNQQPTFYLIDIGRALINSEKSTSNYYRMLDLNRICYKLGLADRELLVASYNRHSPKELPAWWRQSLRSYDLKLKLKKAIR